MVVLRDEGYSLQQIALKLKCNRSTVSRTLARHRTSGSVDDMKKSGRPKLSTSRDDRALQRICLQNRRFTSSQLKREWEQASGVTSSARTVRRRLDDVGLFGRVARKKPLLTERHRQLRLTWAKERKDWGMEDWYKVVWSDESKFNLFGSDGRVYIRRRVGEDYLPECVQSTVKFGGGSVMVWGCITCDGVGPMTKVDGRMNAKDYIGLLEKTLVPFMASMGPEYSFQHDNAPCHRAKSVTSWLVSKNIKQLDFWPPQSPDLNPIEHAWDILGKKMEDKKPKSLKELEERLKEEWLKISPIEIQKLIRSMPKRVAAVIAAKGGHTKY